MKRWYLVLCQLSMTIVFAQEPDVLWENTYGGDYSDFGVSICQTSDSGYVIVGSTKSFGNGGSDVYLFKTDINGNAIWFKTFGGINDEEGWEVQETTDNGFIIVGKTYSFGIGTPDSSNVFLIKTDSNGDTIWTKVFGELRSDEGFSVKQTTDEGYIVVGGTTSLGAGGWDVYFIKTNASGDTLWTKTYGGVPNDVGYSVQQTTDGGYIITGSTRSFGAGSSDVYFIKTDINGDIIWDRTYGGIYYDRGNSVQQTNDEGYIIGGFTFSFGVGAPNYSNSYFIKTNANGDTLWTKAFDESDNDWIRCIQQCLDEGYIGVGCTYSNPIYIGQVYVIKVNINGETLWIKRHGGMRNESGYSIRQTSDGGYIITGCKDLTGNNDWQVYLLKINAIKLIVPNGSEIWAAGAIHDIIWSCENPTIDCYMILFSTDSGNSYTDTIATSIPTDSTSLSWTLPNIICTTCRVKIQALDSLNNLIAEDQSNSNFSIVDLSPPNPFSLILPLDTTYLAITRPTFIWQASFDSTSGLENYEVYINDTLRSPNIDTSWVANYDLHEGYHSWYVIAYDSAGNSRQSNETWMVIIDTTPPTIVDLISPPNYGYLNDSVVSFIWYEATDNLSGVDHYLLQYALDSTFSLGLVETTLVDTVFSTTLSDTIYYWRVKTFDVATNESEFSSIWRFGVGVDTTAPIVPTLLSPINGIILDDTLVNFEWTTVANPADIRKCTQKASSENGKRAEISSAPIRYIIQVDTMLSFVSPLIADTLDTTITSRFLYEYSHFYWRVKAYDWAGNQGPYANPDSFSVDTGPVIESTTVWVDTSFTGPFEISTKVTDVVSGVDSVVLYYKRNEDPDWVSTTMHCAAVQDWYVDSIPEVDTLTIDTVQYYIEATDIAGHVSTDPPGAPASCYRFIANYGYSILEIKRTPQIFSFIPKSNPMRDKLAFKVTFPEGEKITICIYDICGRLIENVVLDKKSAGVYELKGNLNTGVYFVTITVNSHKKVEKVILLK